MSMSRQTDQGSGPDPDRSLDPSAYGSVTGATPPEKFAAALLALYKAAGSPTYAVLIHQAAQQKPAPVKISSQSLSDWLLGHAVPANKAAVRFLVVYLEAIADRRGGYVRRGGDWWALLHANAWTFKRANRGGRPSTRAVPAAASGLSPWIEGDGCGESVLEIPTVAQSIMDAFERLHAALGNAANSARRTALERLFADLETVHQDYLTMFESILEQIPDPWERATPKYADEVRAAAGRLRRLRVQCEPVRVRARAAADAYSGADLAVTERAFVTAVVAYFPTGELRLDGAGPGTSGTAVIDHLYRSLDGDLGRDLGDFVSQTLTFHRQRWLLVCQAHAAMQVELGGDS